MLGALSTRGIGSLTFLFYEWGFLPLLYSWGCAWPQTNAAKNVNCFINFRVPVV